MQAHKLRIADGHHTQVVKVCVEPSSKCAAFLLADSSALLLSLSSPNATTSIPGPCSEACFLRLEASVHSGGTPRLAAHLPPKEKPASGNGGRSTDQDGKLGEACYSFPVGTGKVATGGDRQRGSGDRWLSSGNGKRLIGSERSRVFFLTAQPGNGGSCDLRAWLCEPPSFTRAKIRVEPGTRAQGSGSGHLLGSPTGGWKVARLDVPHGMAVRMVASVNVVVVYSTAVGKIWIMAAKYVAGGDVHGNHPDKFTRGTGFSMSVETEKEVLKMAESRADTERSGHLLLMKCSLVDFSGPVYSLHVSLQHLLLGVSGGVWIWHLRPLIKPEKRQNDTGRTKDAVHSLAYHSASPGYGQLLPSNEVLKQFEGGHRDAGTFAARSLSDERDSNVVKSHQAGEERTVFARLDSLGELKAPIGIRENRAQEAVRTHETKLHQAFQGSVEDVSQRTAAGANVNMNATAIEDPHLLCSNSFLLEVSDHPRGRTMQNVPKRNRLASQLNGIGSELLYNVQGSQSSYSGSENVAIMGASTISRGSHAFGDKTLDPANQSHQLGSHGACFVAICRDHQQYGIVSRKELLQRQVLDIQDISRRRFLVLDSDGDLYLLALGDLQDHGTSGGHVRVCHPQMSPLGLSIKVKRMAVISPTLKSTSMEPKAMMTRIWMSDGRYSSYVVSMSGDKGLEDSKEVRTADLGPRPVVPVAGTQTIFTKDPVAAVASLNAETVLVVTQGGIIVYGLTGN